MDAKQRIELAKARIEKAKRALTIAETEKSAAERQQAEVIAKMAELNVNPDNIMDEIARLENTIGSSLDKIESLIPEV